MRDESFYSDAMFSRALFLALLIFCARPALAAPDSTVAPGYLANLQAEAEAGDDVAQFNLGVLYHNGQGVAQSTPKAVEWLEKSANQGNADAAFNLYDVYSRGQGVPRDDKVAAKWCRKAAERGNIKAQLVLSSLYKKGKGVKKDPAQSAAWFAHAVQMQEAKSLADARAAEEEAQLPARRALMMLGIGVALFSFFMWLAPRRARESA
jgi:TPR repeat protein